MPEFKMSGLRADNAQGWMAAIGVLSILDNADLDVQLSWQEQTPVLHGASEQQVLDALVSYIELGSDIVERLPPGKGGDKAALDLTAGRVNFVDVVQRMVTSVRREHLQAALTQVWRNTDNITSLGWDTRAVKYAYSLGGAKAPDAAPHRGVLAGQWLAAESLPITGTGARSSVYHWVTWTLPLDLGGVRAVVQSLSTDWGGAAYAANVARNGQMGYLEPAKQTSS